ncbi:hypothetical protein Rsub_01242 [Raphidocelis subcapitata]|uniref:Uncharacterized protein n=1 Tax=Raphidocelis subcapitata TaxID=307507 RepID=A0A2V0NUC1_9CHLO|nr:hypothetical protein Rsub_01242 [Raphidocelis subcapitata]|eukprot:GBF88527.1 hypothetical protein Rsub_01242 [Raphidocelis subcapitata]
MPSTTYDMSAPEVSRRPSTRYVEYLHAYTRRIKRGAAAPPSDGAGLLHGARFSGRSTPLKGKGLPPLDNVESPALSGGLRILPGRSYVETDPLNVARAITPEDLSFRPCVRAFKSAFSSSLDGAGAIVTREEPAHRPVRRTGAEAPQGGVQHTKARVVIDALPPLDAAAEFAAANRHSSVRAWRMPTRRPGVDTIIRHRYSDPATEPSSPKFETERVASPSVSRTQPEATRGAFNSAADSYNANKCKALYGSTFRYE